jgi:hypothetical protein
MSGLKRIPIRITGDWRPVAYVGHAEWHGLAVADEPITALALIRGPSEMRWARVGHDGAYELDIALSVRPAESERRKDVVVWLAIRPKGKRGSDGEGRVVIPVRLTSTAPFIFFLNHHVTGETGWFAHAWSKEEERLGALFVAEADTKSARNHLWRLREGVEGPDTAIATALMGGRSGVLALET